MKIKGDIVLIIIALFLLGFTIALGVKFNIPFGDLTRDPLSVTDADPYIGLLSNLGAIFWSFSTILPFFTYSVLNGKINKQLRIFLLYAGLLSLILLVDDFLMLHDKIIPYFLGLDESFILLIYAILLSLYLYYFRNIHLKSNYFLLLTALLFFGISIVVDYFQGAIDSDFRPLYEDGAKFLGITCWTAYHFTLCGELIRYNWKI